MGLKDSIKNYFSSKDKVVGDGTVSKHYNAQSFSTAQSYKSIFEDQYDSVTSPYNQNVWVYSAIKAIADNIGQVDFVVDKVNRDGSKDQLPSTHPLSNLFEEVNPHMTRSDLIRVITTDLLSEGMWFVAKESGTGKAIRPNEVPKELWPLTPSYMEAVADEDSKLLVGWKYTVPGCSPIMYPLHAVIYDRLYNPKHSWKGLSPVTPAWQNILGDQYASTHQASLLKNKAVPEGILISEGKLTPDQAKQIMEKWESRLEGPRRSGRTAILQGGMKYENVSFSAKDLGLEAQQHWDRDAILAAFRVPKFMVGLYEDLNFATSREARRTFWLETLIPISKQITDAFNTQLVTPTSGADTLKGKFDLSSVPALQANLTETLAQATSLRSLGYSANDINDRLDLGMPTLEAKPTVEEVVVEDKSSTIKSLSDDMKELIPLLSSSPEPYSTPDDISTHHTDTLKGKLKNCLWKLRKGYLKDSSDISALLDTFSTKAEEAVDIVRKDVLDDVIAELTEEHGDLISKLDDLSLDNLPNGISEVVELISVKISDDYNIEEIKSLFNSAGTAVSVIAKTELVTFANHARQELLAHAGFKEKTWIASPTCKDHQTLNGEMVQIEDNFSNGLKYPSDIAGGNQIIGCSCGFIGSKHEE